MLPRGDWTGLNFPYAWGSEGFVSRGPPEDFSEIFLWGAKSG